MIDSPFALLGVMALVVSAPLLLRRLRTPQAGALRVVSRTAVTRSTAVAVVAYGEQQWLVGGSDQGVQLLADLSHDGGVGQHGSPSPTRADGLGANGLPGATAPAATPAQRFPDRLPHASTHRAATPVTDDRTTLSFDGQLSAVPGDLVSSTRPRIGLLDLLREKTIRTHAVGRPPRVPRRY